MAVVEARGLTKIFTRGDEGAVNDVNLVTRDGELIRQDLPPPLDVYLIREAARGKKEKG